MNRTKLAGICVLTSTLALSGCLARTYNLTRYRIDQDLSASSGNRGYLIGTAPEPKQRPSTRTTRVFEIELGLPKRTPVSSSIVPSATSTNIEAPTQQQEMPAETTPQNFEKYTVVKNDTLQKISLKFYGTTKKWQKIYEANTTVLRTPDKVYPGQVLNIPYFEGIKTAPEKIKEPQENLK